MSTPSSSLLSCIRDHGLWNACFEEERRRQAKWGRCTTLKREGRRLSWCQRKSHIQDGPCEHCLDESYGESIALSKGNGLSRSGILRVGQTAGAADDHSGFNPRMLWFFVGLERAAEDTRRVSEESRD